MRQRLFERAIILGLLAFLVVVQAQFGINPEQTVQGEEVGISGETPSVEYAIPENLGFSEQVAAKLIEEGGLSNQVAADVAVLIEIAKKDPETALLVKSMTDGAGKETFEDSFRNMTPQQIGDALKETLDVMTTLDVLFQDPEITLKEMDKEGMIPKDKLSVYEKDISKLEEDTRNSIYFSFVSLAAAGGYF